MTISSATAAIFRIVRRLRSGTIGLSSMLEPGRAASRSIISLFQPSAQLRIGCGLLAYVDKETGESRSLKATRCILPAVGGFVRRDRQRLPDPRSGSDSLSDETVGPRGGGSGRGLRGTKCWKRSAGASAKRFRKIAARKSCTTWGGRGTTSSWSAPAGVGIDGHNSHTNVCSSSARLGYLLWHYGGPAFARSANARFILLLSAHLESGIISIRTRSALSKARWRSETCGMDPRLSTRRAWRIYWMPSYPARKRRCCWQWRWLFSRESFRCRFREELDQLGRTEVDGCRAQGQSFGALIEALKRHYAKFTPEFAEKESGVKAEIIVKTAREIATAGSRFASHLWRGSSSGNLGGWQSARALMLLHVLTGSVGTPGGHNLNAWNNLCRARTRIRRRRNAGTNCCIRRSGRCCARDVSLLPHFLKEGRGRIEAYFTACLIRSDLS